MFEWLLKYCVSLLINVQILFKNPAGSRIVSILQILSVFLIIAFFTKLTFHILFYRCLRKRFHLFYREDSKKLFTLLHLLCRKLKMRKLPIIYKFSETKPLIFTIGVLKPAIFISPRLLSNLSYEELKAVLTHELYHIKRRDALSFWLYKLITALLPVLIILVEGFQIHLAL